MELILSKDQNYIKTYKPGKNKFYDMLILYLE